MAQKTKKRTSSFRGKVATNAQRTSKQGNTFGYLKLPKGVEFLNPDPDGIIKLDFIPYIVTDSKHPDKDSEGTAVKGSIWWRRPFMIHRNVGIDAETVVCLKSFGQKCPICEFRAKRKAAGADNEELKAYNSSSRNLYLVIPKGSKKFEEKLHVLDISDFLFQNLLTKELKMDPDKEIFPDLEEGYTVKVRFEPGTFTTKNPYPEASRIDFIERDEQYDPDYINDVPSLDDILIKMDYAEMESKFLEGTEGKTDDDEEEEIIEDESPRKSRVKKSLPIIEEEDDDEEEEDVPVRKSKKPTRKPIVEEDEEDDDEEEYVPVKKKPAQTTKKPIKRVIEEEDDEDDDDEEEIIPRKKSKTTPAPKAKSKKTCPHGLKFGIDTEQYDVCDTCDVWSECVAEHEKE